ncbi:MAG: hypothetical protein GXP19_07055 [Gammaproteobacteria bacterium]|nr:hypothetical protein [Gammaproteobacteria bacterium]
MTKITHGIAIGDVRSHSAVIWSRSNRQAKMHVRLKAIHGDGDKKTKGRVNTCRLKV